MPGQVQPLKEGMTTHAKQAMQQEGGMTKEQFVAMQQAKHQEELDKLYKEAKQVANQGHWAFENTAEAVPPTPWVFENAAEAATPNPTPKVAKAAAAKSVGIGSIGGDSKKGYYSGAQAARRDAYTRAGYNDAPYMEERAKRAPQQNTIEQEMERIFATTEPMMEISARIMEMKADDGVGQKLGRATAKYCDKMMEYFEDEGFTREESMQLLTSMIRNNSVITGG